jgi:hypothetical protein
MGLARVAPLPPEDQVQIDHLLRPEIHGQPFHFDASFIIHGADVL